MFTQLDAKLAHEVIRASAVFPKTSSLHKVVPATATGLYGQTLDSFVRAAVSLKTNAELHALGPQTQTCISDVLDVLCTLEVFEDLALAQADGIVLQCMGHYVVHLQREGSGITGPSGQSGRTVFIELSGVRQLAANYSRMQRPWVFTTTHTTIAVVAVAVVSVVVGAALKMR